jgi:hypothetical protein
MHPIRQGHEQQLAARLEGLPTGHASPLARVTGTHFARWVIVDQFRYEGPPQRPDTFFSQYLLFTSSFDGDLDPYLEELRVQLGPEADAVWEHCLEYPGSVDRERFRDYFRRNRIDTNMFYAAYPEATVADVRRSLGFRQGFVAFAQQVQEEAPDGLYSRWRERFR